MFCPECQTELREGVRQCPICGTRQPITLPPAGTYHAAGAA